jgi:2-succinyl-5-enolpyruvyl-6-hydroxy-3-cyclohexene-1-carboxylate synthase
VRFQPIYDIAELCFQKGITNAVLCPGSRCAPLTLAFARHTKIKTWTFSDERSAAFIALGMTLQTSKPTVLVCTSGTAVYNFAPAVAEAFYQQLPLIVITADRPKEWIDQWDGQTIHQEFVYGKHVKKYFELPEDDDGTNATLIHARINAAINLSHFPPHGPVHINAPFREPLYPTKEYQTSYSQSLQIVQPDKESATLSKDTVAELEKELAKFQKIILVVGQQHEVIDKELEDFSTRHHIPIIGDIISNMHGVEQAIRHTDSFLGQSPGAIKKALQPELLLTLGKSVVSKNLKLYLRNFKPKEHWHIYEAEGNTPDPFRTLTRVVKSAPRDFLAQIRAMPKTGFDDQKRENFYWLWKAEEHRTVRAIENHFSAFQLNEFFLVNEVLRWLPENTHLHLANSMSVRYANFIGLDQAKKSVKVFSNRGTSGIDGCTSTSVGQSLAGGGMHVLITGDMAFFYDRNAFWHNYKLPNLRIVVLNNHGGSIFGIIDGPSDLPEAKDYFITQQRLTAKKICEEFDFDHIRLDSARKVKNQLKDFFDMDGRTKILEIETDHQIVKDTVTQFLQKIKSNYEA